MGHLLQLVTVNGCVEAAPEELESKVVQVCLGLIEGHHGGWRPRSEKNPRHGPIKADRWCLQGIFFFLSFLTGSSKKDERPDGGRLRGS
jgi:hypothetical protein